MKVCVYDAYAEDLKTVLDSSGTTGPESADVRSFLPGLGNIGRVDGDADAVASMGLDERIGADMEIELHPVHVLSLECLAVALLGLASEAS